VNQCFVAGTRIETPQGNVAIESLKSGDQVYSFDVKTEKLVPTLVSKLLRREVQDRWQVTFANGTILEVTSEHPFWDPVLNKYRPIKDFKINDQALVVGNDGIKENVAVLEKKFIPGTIEVYNLSVGEPYRNYLAEGVLVHNKQDYTCVPQ